MNANNLLITVTSGAGALYNYEYGKIDVYDISTGNLVFSNIAFGTFSANGLMEGRCYAISFLPMDLHTNQPYPDCAFAIKYCPRGI